MRFRKTREDIMDAYLDSIGLWRKPTAKDGSCLFRVVAEQLFQTQVFHAQVRKACIEYLYKHRNFYRDYIQGSYDEYLYQLEDPKVWAGQVEISALSFLYGRDFIIYQTVGKPPVNATQNGFNEKIVLCFTDGNHYDSVYPKPFGQSIAICQSIVYEILYRGVFKLDHELKEAVRFIRQQSRSRRYRRDSSSNWQNDLSITEGEQLSSSNCQPEFSSCNHGNKFHEDLGRLIDERASPPVPFRIAKALDPEIYRNVELDTWQESKKEQQQRDLELAQGSQFAPGDKCQVLLVCGGEENLYHAHIQEIRSQDKGPVVVFIEELGQKLDVPVSSLRPIVQLSTSPQSESFARRRGRRGKGVAIIVGQNSNYMSPPTGEGRGRTWNGGRCLSPRYPGGPIHKTRHLIDSAGHPIRPKWQQDSLYMRSNLHHGPPPSYWKPPSTGYWRPQLPSHVPTYMCNRPDEGVIMSSPTPGDLPPEMVAPTMPTLQDEPCLVNGIEHLSVNGQPEPEGNSLPMSNMGSPTVHQYQQPYHHPTSYGPPQMPIQTQQLPPQPQGPANGIQQVLVPVYPSIPVPYADIASGHINLNCGLSLDPNGSDMPLSDLPTLRFFYNLGLNYYRWYSYMASCSQIPPGRMESVQPNNTLGKLGNQDKKFSVGQYSYRETVVRGRTYRSSFISETSSQIVSSENSNSYDVLDKKSESCTHSDSGCDSESSSVGDSANENTACSIKSESPCMELTRDDGSVEEDPSCDSSSHNGHKAANEKSDQDLHETLGSVAENTDLGDEPETETETETGDRPKQSQRKYYTWGPYKLLKPIKDIPPRFQQMLAETNAQKARCEGIPIVYQCDPSLTNSHSSAYNSAFGEGDRAEFQLNPSAPDFTPTSSCEVPGENGWKSWQGPTSSQASPGNNPGYGNGCPVPSTAVPCTTTTSTSNVNNNPGVVYYSQPLYPAQPMMGYNYSVPYVAAQQPSVPSQPPPSHCISPYTVYGHSQP